MRARIRTDAYTVDLRRQATTAPVAVGAGDVAEQPVYQARRRRYAPVVRIVATLAILAGGAYYLPTLYASLSYFSDTQASVSNSVQAGAVAMLATLLGEVDEYEVGDAGVAFTVETTLQPIQGVAYSAVLDANGALCPVLNVTATFDGVPQVFPVDTILTGGTWAIDVVPNGVLPSDSVCVLTLSFSAYSLVLGPSGGGFTDTDVVVVTLTAPSAPDAGMEGFGSLEPLKMDGGSLGEMGNMEENDTRSDPVESEEIVGEIPADEDVQEENPAEEYGESGTGEDEEIVQTPETNSEEDGAPAPEEAAESLEPEEIMGSNDDSDDAAPEEPTSAPVQEEQSPAPEPETTPEDEQIPDTEPTQTA